MKSDGVFVHHTTGETPAEHARCPVLWEQHRQYHIDHRGYKDIGYSFGFCPHGSRLQGRGWDVIGAHTKDWNSRSHGFAFLGDGNQITVVALSALRALIVEHDQRYGQGFVRGHRDVAQTACPGDKLYAALPSIRREEEDMNAEQDQKLEEIHQAMRLTVQPFVDEVKSGEWIVKPLVAEMQKLAPTIGEDAIVSAVKRALIEGTS